MSLRKRKLAARPPSPSSSSCSSKSADVPCLAVDCDESDQKQLIEKLRAAHDGLLTINKGLIEDNAKKTIKIGTLIKERLDLINQINKLHLELGSWKTRNNTIARQAKVLHSKYVMLSDDFVQIVVNSTKPVYVEMSSPEPREASTSKSGAFSMSTVQQQTQAVKPMISGHTIQSPVINLPRVSPEQLERLSERVRQGNAEENSDAEWQSDVSDNVEGDENPVDVEAEVEVDGNIEPANAAELDLIETEAVNDQLSTVEEEHQTTVAEQTAGPNSLTTILEESDAHISTVVSRSLRTRARRENVASLPVASAASVADAFAANNSNISNSTLVYEDTSLADISNTRGHVTVRRGRPRKRPNITVIDHEEESTLSPSISVVEVSNLADETTNALLESQYNGDPLSNTLFIEGLGSGTSTPAPPPRTKAKRRKTRAEVENENGDDTTLKRVSLTRNLMRPCSVVLKRIVAAPKRRSISPRKRPPSEGSESSASSVSTDTSQRTTPGGHSSRTRPTRRAKPKSLKEENLKGKMRRL